jgi:integrase
MNLLPSSEGFALQTGEMVASHSPVADEMDAYERVLGAAMAGDSTLFAREDYVEQAWRIVEPVLKSLLNLYVLLQKMLNLAVALELLNSNPMQRVPKPKVERTEKPSQSPAQVKAIADNMPQNLKALVVLLYLTGLRIGEALALKWSDVDFDQSKLYVRRSVWRRKEQTPKSRKSIRAKHLLGGLARVLQSHRELCVGRQPEDYLFVNAVGRSYDPDDVRRRMLYPAMDKAGIERKVRGLTASICSGTQPDHRCRRSRAT